MSKESVARFFDNYAEDFDAIYGCRNTIANRLINGVFRRSMRLRFEKTIAGCQPIDGLSVLDIGCGGGHYATCLARAGAARVVGVDFADQMLALARAKAEQYRVDDRCEFVQADFNKWETSGKFDFTILMGFMDYVEDARSVIARAISMTSRRAFFSFPVDSGVLAWQRRLRYRQKCDLYMYNRDQITRLFEEVGGCTVDIERIARDYFVTASVK
jgi:predicted TPR repeat methyltransferase